MVIHMLLHTIDIYIYIYWYFKIILHSTNCWFLDRFRIPSQKTRISSAFRVALVRMVLGSHMKPPLSRLQLGWLQGLRLLGTYEPGGLHLDGAGSQRWHLWRATLRRHAETGGLWRFDPLVNSHGSVSKPWYPWWTPSHSWFMDVHPKNGVNRYWFIPM